MLEILKPCLLQRVAGTVQRATVNGQNRLSGLCRFHDYVHTPADACEARHLPYALIHKLPGGQIGNLADVCTRSTQRLSVPLHRSILAVGLLRRELAL
jgi:hypothetical protein